MIFEPDGAWYEPSVGESTACWKVRAGAEDDEEDTGPALVRVIHTDGDVDTFPQLGENQYEFADNVVLMPGSALLLPHL